MDKNIRVDIRRDELQKNNIELNKTASFYNPYTLTLPNGKGYLLNRLFFFDPNTQEVIIKNQSSWFGNNNEIWYLRFWTDKSLVKKIKIDLSVKHPFYIKDDCLYESRYNLYIPTTDLPYIQYSYYKAPKLGIMRNTDIGQPNPEHNYLHELVHYFDKSTLAQIAFENKLQKIKETYNIISYPDEQWKNIIHELTELKHTYSAAKKEEDDYTVQDYLKEIK